MTFMENTLTPSESSLDAPQQRLLLSHGTLKFAFTLPSSVYGRASHLGQDFVASLSQPSKQDGVEVDEPPSCVEELVTRFLAFLASEIERSANNDKELNQEILLSVLRHFETELLRNNDVHTVVAALPIDHHAKVTMIRDYYQSLSSLGHLVEPVDSNLLRAAKVDSSRVSAVFGGQGSNEYFDELRDLYATYPHFLGEFIAEMSDHLVSLSRCPRARQTYPRGLNPMRWLLYPNEQPSPEYLLGAPLSFPIIGLLQLSYYSTTCNILGITPKVLRDCYRGLTGHSQGLIIAAIVSKADSWESFRECARTALSALFWIGLRCQQVFPPTTVAPWMAQESIDAGEREPSPMLSVRELPEKILKQQVDSTNQFLPRGKKLVIGLYNSDSNFVVSGPTSSLCGLSTKLRKLKSTPDQKQARLPFSERKLSFTSVFLPTTAPYHSPYLHDAFNLVCEDIRELEISRDDLRVPLYSTNDGSDLRHHDQVNVLPELIRLITSATLHWKKAVAFPDVTHILDFGPGGSVGIGFLTQQIKEGRGVRVISATTMDTRSPISSMGTKEELFDRDPQRPVKQATDWLKVFGPGVRRNDTGQSFPETKFSKLLGLPPVMVAGMTPCTVPWDFVAATMNAGYHIELAGGGYYNSQAFADAIRNIVRVVSPGRGVTLNLIYANPSAISWQIPLIRRLRAEGVPIDGLTIGAGIPTLEIANEYIQTLKLRHISFKPGSIDAIHEVIRVARDNPNFPVILQWTGGRGGGHHSFEDFHQPLLQSYGKIRDCPNIILVAGSGFGGARDTFPYLNGSWTSPFNHAPMPFDGILLGSRVMIAKEAHTSRQAKELIAEAPGIDDSSWEGTYKGPSGGVMTVLSEMREPIHKLATRGVRFWAEMDKMIFSLDRNKRVTVLQENRDYIIERLNSDFQKVWFGKNAAGKPVNLEQMSYLEVIRRLAELLYIKSQSRWIDVSYKALFGDFVRRAEERFASEKKPSLVQKVSDISNPTFLADEMSQVYPRSSKQFISAQDTQYFLGLCQRRGQKPVPFVPTLDENFEFYFKKDSLWQSEDIDAVVGKDAGRTAILQGPVATKYAKVVDEPIKDILNGICASHVEELENAKSEHDDTAFRVQASEQPYSGVSNGLPASCDSIVHRISASTHSALPDADTWLELLAGSMYSWRQTFFQASSLVREKRIVENPFKRLFAPSWNIEVLIERPDQPSKTVVKLKEFAQDEQQPRVVIELKANSETKVDMIIYEHLNAAEAPVGLHLQFTFDSGVEYAPIRDLTERRDERVKDFYRKLWFGNEEILLSTRSVTDVFHGGRFEVQEQDVVNFVQAVKNPSDAYASQAGRLRHAPMDFAIKAAWKGMTRPLFLVNGDLLDLVHLHNSFQMLAGANPLQAGDVLHVTSRVNAIRILSSGKMVEVCGTIERGGVPIIHVTSRFLYRGLYSDYEHTFERRQEVPALLHLKSPQDVTLFRSKEWFDEHDPDYDLLGRYLLVRLESNVQYKTKDEISNIETHGTVWLSSSTGEAVSDVGVVKYTAGRSVGNPVTDYLERHGSPLDQLEVFENPGLLSSVRPLSFQAPASNELYSVVSGDFNPIHVSRVFASYAGLPGTIVHGMHLSALVRGLTENYITDGDVRLMKSFECSFDGMVLPNDRIDVRISHVGMISGRKAIKVEAIKEDGEIVLTGSAEVDQPASAFVFTGQGSQVQGMGMDLYAQNEAAREVWDRADTFLLENYGFSILKIVKENPKTLKIHFGGLRGRAIRDNYMRMMVDKQGVHGKMTPRKVFDAMDEATRFHVFHHPQGLLYSTQFAQPALTIFAQAAYASVQGNSIVPKDCNFAGHSLGEYAALSVFGEFMPIERVISIVFYRGLTMQLCVERDDLGRTDYSMCALNPSKVMKGFREQNLVQLLEMIRQETHWLIEIVNWNIQNLQYVCAGDLRALDTLISVTSHLSTHQSSEKSPFASSFLVSLVRMYSDQALSKPQPVELKRTNAVAPLFGIDVPFHSTFLRPGIGSFRTALKNAIKEEEIDPRKLVGRYIPNLTGKPFDITRDYFEEVAGLTGSAEIKTLLDEVDTRVF